MQSIEKIERNTVHFLLCLFKEDKAEIIPLGSRYYFLIFGTQWNKAGATDLQHTADFQGYDRDQPEKRKSVLQFLCGCLSVI